jgi:tetratricopeptide (TPR) repeat protein
MSTALITAAAAAYDYPVVGDFNENYQKVLDQMKKGNCAGMKDELFALESKEGISAAIYLSLCYFEKNEEDKGFLVLDKMLLAQEFDEVLYVVQSRMDKGVQSPKNLKYRGLAYFNIGALASALADFEKYLSTEMDGDIVYTLTDIYMTLKNYEKAESTIERSPNKKGGGYLYRKGRIALRTGKTVSALGYFRMVQPTHTNVYGNTKMLIGEICTGAKRYLCAEKEFTIAAGLEDFKESAAVKMDAMNKSKKAVSGFLSFGEHYDSNVTSVDADEVPGASEVSSLRTYAFADIRLNLYPSFTDALSIGMLHYKTWNHDIPSYDLGTHKIYAEMKRIYDTYEIIFPRFSAAKTYFGGDSFSQAYSAEASVTYNQDSVSYSVPLRVTYTDYSKKELVEELEKTGYKYETGLNVSMKLSDKYTWKIGGEYAYNDTEGEYKIKNDYIFKTSLGVKLLQKLTATGAFNYTYYSYSNIDREDDYFTASLKTLYLLTDKIFLGAGITWSKTDSSIDAYDFDKTVTEISISYAL